MSRTRKWPPSPSSPPVPTGSRSDERAALLRETFLRRDDAARSSPPDGDPGRSRAGAEQVVRFPPPDLWRPHQPSYNRYVRGRETAASQQGRHADHAQARSGQGTDGLKRLGLYIGRDRRTRENEPDRAFRCFDDSDRLIRTLSGPSIAARVRRQLSTSSINGRPSSLTCIRRIVTGSALVALRAVIATSCGSATRSPADRVCISLPSTSTSKAPSRT